MPKIFKKSFLHSSVRNKNFKTMHMYTSVCMNARSNSNDTLSSEVQKWFPDLCARQDFSTSLFKRKAYIHKSQKFWTTIKNLRIQCASILQKKFKEFLKCLKTLSPFCILICNYSFKAMLVYSLLCENAQNNSNDVVSS